MKRKLLSTLILTVFCGVAFAAADTDGATNNSATSPSMKKAVSDAIPPFEELDKNGDKVLTKEESKSIPELAENYGKLDYNGDGEIGKSSYYVIMNAVATGKAPVMPSFSALDINEDGSVNETEYKAFNLELTRFNDLIKSGDLRISDISNQASQNLMQGSGNEQGADSMSNEDNGQNDTKDAGEEMQQEGNNTSNSQ